MKLGILFLPALFYLSATLIPGYAIAQTNSNNSITKADTSVSYTVKKCGDFKVSGDGGHQEWRKAEWATFTRIQSEGNEYVSRSKMMYSEKGIYLLFSGTDKKITTQNWKDFETIYEGDVFEVFFHPDPANKQYFEYEINPLGRELLLILTRTGKRTLSWIPWLGEYKAFKVVERAVNIKGGKQEIGANITSWTAEIFLSYDVLALLPNTPPKSGTTWNANFCRIDYDDGKQIEYSWSPTMTTGFHALEHFQKIVFE